MAFILFWFFCRTSLDALADRCLLLTGKSALKLARCCLLTNFSIKKDGCIILRFNCYLSWAHGKTNYRRR